MLRVLLVEDAPEKLRRVMSALLGLPECSADLIDAARDAVDAKRLLRQKQYDLMILDVALPERPESDPSPSGGVALLDEVLERDGYIRPTHIVGLTAFEEIMESAGARFAEDAWALIYYETSASDWFEKLKRKIRYIDLVKSGAVPPSQYETSLCVLTALPDPELAAVLRLPWNWEVLNYPSDSALYHRGYYMHGEERRSVIAAAAPRMGMTASASLAMKMLIQFRPRYIAMVGILAGVQGQCNIGDVVAGDPVWDYGSGKHHVKNGKRVFSAFPYQLGLDSFVRSQLYRLSQDRLALQEIRDAWPGSTPDTVLKLHIGPLACGAAVLADEMLVSELIKSQNRKVVGLDMESYGVMGAADECPLPAAKAFCLKSVCDFASVAKDDLAQPYSAYTSAAVLKKLAEEFLQ